MKNDYKKLQAALDELNEARNDFVRASNQAASQISGPSPWNGEAEALDAAYTKAEDIVLDFIANGARLSYLLDFVSPWGVLVDHVEQEIDDRVYYAGQERP